MPPAERADLLKFLLDAPEVNFYNFGDVPPVHDRTAINGLLNGSIDLKTRDERWDVRLWGRNLTDTRFGAPINQYVNIAKLLGYTGAYYSLMQWNPPRTFGVTVTYHLR